MWSRSKEATTNFCTMFVFYRNHHVPKIFIEVDCQLLALFIVISIDSSDEF